MIEIWELFLDSMGGSVCPFLIGWVICLVNPVNERDLSLLNNGANESLSAEIS